VEMPASMTTVGFWISRVGVSDHRVKILLAS
jgi:hypothetical protein